VAHAAELAPLLDDTALHEFTGGAPLSAAALAVRYARLAARRSPEVTRCGAQNGRLNPAWIRCARIAVVVRDCISLSAER
jgi:hypothetical protein